MHADGMNSIWQNSVYSYLVTCRVPPEKYTAGRIYVMILLTNQLSNTLPMR